MKSPKIKFHARKDKLAQLISFSHTMVRAVKMGQGEQDALSEEQYAELLEIEDTLSTLYRQMMNAR